MMIKSDKAGQIKGYQVPTGIIIVLKEPSKGAHTVSRVVVYAQASSHEHRANLERQVQRLEQTRTSRGYQVVPVV